MDKRGGKRKKKSRPAVDQYWIKVVSSKELEVSYSFGKEKKKRATRGMSFKILPGSGQVC